MDVHMFRVTEGLKRMSHQDESFMRALTTETTLTTGQAVQRAARKTRGIAVHMEIRHGPKAASEAGPKPHSTRKKQPSTKVFFS